MQERQKLSPIQEKLIEIIRAEPAWGQPSMLAAFNRIKAGDTSEASGQQWLDERAAAEAAHMAEEAAPVT